MYFSKLELRDTSQIYQVHRTVMHGFGDDIQNERVLFRVEGGKVVVQSRQSPDWDQLGMQLLSYHVTQKTLRFYIDQSLNFSLLANPTVKRNGRRHGLHAETEQKKWMERKAELGGFEIRNLDISQKDVLKDQTKSGHLLSLIAVLFSGTLTVRDPEKMYISVSRGIGSGKGFGLGLLSVKMTTTR